MKDYREYFKSKAGPIKGSATLKPPVNGQQGLQSVASMSVLDLISEGPIYGLVDSEGRKTNNMSILNSLYLDDTRVLDKGIAEPQIRTVDFDQIQMMGRLTSGNIDIAFDNISGQFEAHKGANANNPSIYVHKTNGMAQDKQALMEFVEENKSLSRFGMIQFKLSGIFPTGDAIYSRLNTTTNKFSKDQNLLLDNPENIRAFDIKWTKVGTTTTTSATAVMQGGVGPRGSKRWNITQGSNTWVLQKFDGITDEVPGVTDFYWRFGNLSSWAEASSNGSDISNTIPGATMTSSDYPWGNNRTSSVWYDAGALGNTAGNVEEYTVVFSNFTDTAESREVYNMTTFNLDVYNGTDLASRLIKNKEAESIEVPSPIVYGAQFLNNSKFGSYAAAPATKAINQAGKVGNQYLIDGFAGGGIYFFEIGDNEELTANGDFNTGKFFVDKAGVLYGLGPNTLQSGLDNGYDVFVYDGATGPISLESPSPNQSSPIVGELAGQEIGLGYTSDLDLRYNYGNVDFDFRNGFESQPKMIGHSDGVQDFQVRKKLFGPLSYGGSATRGAGEGYSDVRGGGDFSTWMLNPPLESDAYSYTHTIKRIDVDKCTPTIAIEGLSDIIADGDTAGVQQAETLLMGFTYGFEGGVIGAVGDLLSAGNDLKDIALGLSQISETSTYIGIVVSNYLDTYDEIGDLPKNKSLKKLRVNDTDVPGLTQAMIDTYGYTSGDLIFPGEDWKVPNRFLKIEKKSFETDSTLISRECSLSYVSERIGEPFSYPLVATAGTIFDARNFAAQPSRDFEVRGKLIAIPSNYEPLNTDGSDKRFISSSKNYGLRSIQKFDGSSNYAKVYDHIDLGTNNFEIEARIGFGSITTSAHGTQYIVDMDGGNTQTNRVAIYQGSNAIGALITHSTLTDGAANGGVSFSISIDGRNNEHKYAEWEYINNLQNLTANVADVNITNATPFNIEFDLLIGDNNTNGHIFWTHGSYQRIQIKWNTNGRINMQLSGLTAGQADGNGDIADTTVPGVSANSTRDFSKFEFVKFKIEGNLSTGIKLRDRSDDSIIVELTTAVLNPVLIHTNGMARISNIYILGINSQNVTPSHPGSGAMRNLSVQGVSIFTDTYNTSPVLKKFNTDPNFTTVGDVNPADIYDISLKAVGQKYTLEVKVGDEVVGTSSQTISSPRGNINFGGINNLNADSPPYLFIGYSNGSNINYQLKAETKLSDLKIRKNNQLIHHWDGTVIDTVRHDNCIKDRVGGFHAKVFGPVNTVLDSNFIFGKNKKRIYNGAWDGTFKLGWTDNPAWILYDLMINPIYGVGNSIDDREDINIFNLYQIAKYCDAVDNDGYFDGLPDSTQGLEPRFSCNLRIYDPKNAFEVIGNVASIFRGFTYWDGVGLNFAIDKDKQESALFNNGNVFDGIFNYADITSSARFTKIEVMYSDRGDFYSTKSEYIEDEEGIRKYGLVGKILNGIGCTSKSQAKRMGKYVLFSNKMETEIVTFRASSECFFLEPGDIIRIDDEVKNFEINYGKVLGVKAATPDPYITVESDMNTSNIKLGSAGGVYLYTNRKQNELENIYDIVKYQTVHQYGEDSDVYSGVVNSDFINEQSLTEVQKMQVTGATSQGNSVRLYLETGDSNFKYLSGVQPGSFFNVELNNDVNKTYKVIKKRQQENNVFDIEAMQYDLEKFKKIEEEDFDDEEITYNIGIPAHVINRPLVPTDVTETIFQRNNLSYAATGTITAASNSNETSYRVVAYRENQAGPYIQKEFQRESDDTTDYEINGLIDGNYTLITTALRNPESSSNFVTKFSIESKRDVHMHELIKKIEIGRSNINNYERISGSGFGSGSSSYQDVEYRFVTVDKKDRVFSLTQLDYTLDVFVEKSGEYIAVAEDHEMDTFTFNDVENMTLFGDYNYSFNAKFNLKKDGTVVDSAFFETNVINLN